VLLRGLDRHAALLEQSAGLGQESLPGVSQSNGVVIAIQEFHTELILESTDLSAKRRLRNVEFTSGPGKAQFCRHAHEITQMA
jgi:hypothetical protein